MHLDVAREGSRRGGGRRSDPVRRVTLKDYCSRGATAGPDRGRVGSVGRSSSPFAGRTRSLTKGRRRGFGSFSNEMPDDRNRVTRISFEHPVSNAANPRSAIHEIVPEDAVPSPAGRPGDTGRRLAFARRAAASRAGRSPSRRRPRPCRRPPIASSSAYDSPGRAVAAGVDAREPVGGAGGVRAIAVRRPADAVADARAARARGSRSRPSPSGRRTGPIAARTSTTTRRRPVGPGLVAQRPARTPQSSTTAAGKPATREPAAQERPGPAQPSRHRARTACRAAGRPRRGSALRGRRARRLAVLLREPVQLVVDHPAQFPAVDLGRAGRPAGGSPRGVRPPDPRRGHRRLPPRPPPGPGAGVEREPPRHGAEPAADRVAPGDLGRPSGRARGRSPARRLRRRARSGGCGGRPPGRPGRAAASSAANAASSRPLTNRSSNAASFSVVGHASSRPPSGMFGPSTLYCRERGSSNARFRLDRPKLNGPNGLHAPVRGNGTCRPSGGRGPGGPGRSGWRGGGRGRRGGRGRGGRAWRGRRRPRS